MISLIIFFCFFSSRRRHTRYIGDWSSDVCSSDLIAVSFAQSRNDFWSATVVFKPRLRLKKPERVPGRWPGSFSVACYRACFNITRNESLLQNSAGPVLPRTARVVFPVRNGNLQPRPNPGLGWHPDPGGSG